MGRGTSAHFFVGYFIKASVHFVLLERIIRHLPLSCVIIFLYLKRGREPLFARIYAATTLGIDGRMIDVELDVSPGLPGFEVVGLPDTSVLERKYQIIRTGKALQ